MCRECGQLHSSVLERSRAFRMSCGFRLRSDIATVTAPIDVYVAILHRFLIAMCLLSLFKQPRRSNRKRAAVRSRRKSPTVAIRSCRCAGVSRRRRFRRERSTGTRCNRTDRLLPARLLPLPPPPRCWSCPSTVAPCTRASTGS